MGKYFGVLNGGLVQMFDEKRKFKILVRLSL
jgi:hypothetical protein